MSKIKVFGIFCTGFGAAGIINNIVQANWIFVLILVPLVVANIILIKLMN